MRVLYEGSIRPTHVPSGAVMHCHLANFGVNLDDGEFSGEVGKLR
jgi:hypothetical protein